MNKATKTSTALVYLLLTVFLMGISSMAVADIHYFVQMKVAANEKELTIKTRAVDAGGCSAFRGRGCVRANKGDVVKVSFLLAGDTHCKAEGGVSWKLRDVKLGGKDDSSKPSTWGGLAGYPEVVKDFDFLDITKDDGILRPAAPQTDRQITIEDRNSAKYHLWYKVTADCHDAAGAVVKTITSDPRIENEGTN